MDIRILAPIIGLFVAIPFVVFVGFLISLTGWYNFSQTYPAPLKPIGQSYRVPVIQFANLIGRYNNVARVIFAPPGMYFYAIFPLSLSNKPFLLPWNSITSIQKKTFFFAQYYVLEVKDNAGTFTAWLRQDSMEDLFHYCSRSLLIPT